jgi:hypothetical protein
MKTLILLSILFPLLAQAEDLVLKSAQIACIDKKLIVTDDPFKYRYGVELVVENISKERVVVSTAVNSLVRIYNGNNYETTLSYDIETRGHSALIPTREKLKLVELYPGDITLISHQFSEGNKIEKTSIELLSRKIYDGRFNNWVGSLKSEILMPLIVYKCKT